MLMLDRPGDTTACITGHTLVEYFITEEKREAPRVRCQNQMFKLHYSVALNIDFEFGDSQGKKRRVQRNLAQA